MLPAGAGKDNRASLVFVQITQPIVQAVVGDIDRIDYVPGGIVLLGPQVHNHRVFAVDQRGGLLGGDGLAGLAALGHDQQGHYHQKGDGQERVVAKELGELGKEIDYALHANTSG